VIKISTKKETNTDMTLGQAKNVLVGGGSGFVGKHVVQSLLNKGYNVTVLTRSTSEAKTHFSEPSLQQVVRSKQLEFTTWNELKTFQKPIAAGINLTGKSIFDGRWTESYRKTLYDSRIGPTRQLIQFLSRQETQLSNDRKPVFVGTSAVGIYPVDEPNQIYAESTPLSVAKNGSGELCQAIENSISEESEKNGNAIHWSVMRPGAVLGPDGGALVQMALPFYLGFTFYPNGGKQPFPFIHVQDLANLYIFAMEKGLEGSTSMHGAVNGVAPDLITSKQFSESLSRHLNRSFLPLFPMPGVLLDVALGKDRALVLNHGQKVTPEKALKAGFEFKYPNLESSLDDICKNIELRPKWMR